MALSYKNDNEADERLNPSSKAASGLQQQEQAGYDREFGAMAANYGRNADGAQENANIAKTNDQEKNPSQWKNNTTSNGAPNQNEKMSFKGFGKNLKKRGPLAAILGVLGLSGLGFSFILAPGIGLVHLKEIVSDDLNDQLGASSIRQNMMLKAKLKSIQADNSICSGPVKIRCKYSTMSEKRALKFQESLEREGYKVTKEKTATGGLTGRERVTGIEAPDGRPLNPQQLIDESINNPKLGSALRQFSNPKFATLYDKVANGVFQKFKTSKAQKVKGDTDEERNKSITDATNGDGVKEGIKGNSVQEDDKGRYIEDADNNKVYEVDDANNPDKPFASLEKQNSTIGNVKPPERGSAAGSLLKGGLKGASVTGAADTACTVYNTANAVAAAAKVTRSLQLAQYAMVFFVTADRIKDGSATDKEVETLGNKLTSIDTNQTIQNESSVLKNGKVGPPTANPFYGKNAFDSPGYAVAAYNDAPTLTSRSQQYMVGGGLSGRLSSVSRSITDTIGSESRTAIRASCGKIQSWWARSAGLVAGVVSAVGSFGVVTALSIGASLALSFAMPFLQAQLADIVAGKVVDGDTAGVDSGDAIFAGSGALLGGMAAARGMKPANKSDMKEYIAATSEIKAQDIALDTYDAQSTPFDVTKQYSFLGSFVRKINPVILKSEASFTGALFNVPSILKMSASVFMPKVGAVVEFNPDRFSKCNDPGYKELGIDADIFCNPRYAMASDELNKDPDQVLDYMLKDEHIDNDGAPKSDEYKKWIKYCVDREAGWGEVTEEDNTKGADGSICMTDGDKGEYKFFRVFQMDNGLNDALDDGPITQKAGGGETASNAGTATGAVSADGWAYPVQAGAPITSAYKTPGRPGHRGVDIGAPMGSPIFAARDGIVIAAGPADGFGNWIVVKHDIDGKQVDTVYGHMYNDGLLVKVGDKVVAGQEIAKVGSNGQSSGPHLHFEVWNGGRLSGGSETDPAPLIKGGA